MAWILLAIVVVAVWFVVSLYNRLVGARNGYKNAFAQIDVQVKRRYELIPNLVEAAKGVRPLAEAVTRDETTKINVIPLALPKSDWMQQGGRIGHHSEHLGHLLSELQSLQRTFPGATW